MKLGLLTFTVGLLAIGVQGGPRRVGRSKPAEAIQARQATRQGVVHRLNYPRDLSPRSSPTVPIPTDKCGIQDVNQSFQIQTNLGNGAPTFLVGRTGSGSTFLFANGNVGEVLSSNWQYDDYCQLIFTGSSFSAPSDPYIAVMNPSNSANQVLLVRKSSPNLQLYNPLRCQTLSIDDSINCVAGNADQFRFSNNDFRVRLYPATATLDPTLITRFGANRVYVG